MTNVLHVNDIGAAIYIDVTDSGESLGAALIDFTTRTVRIRRATLDDKITITDVPVYIDPDDSVMKLKLLTGTSTSLTLTGTGGFKLLSTTPGIWIAEVELADADWDGRSNAIELFELRLNIA